MTEPFAVALFLGIAAFAAAFLMFARFTESRPSRRALAVGAAALGSVVTLYLLGAPERLQDVHQIVAEHMLALLIAALAAAVAAWRILRHI